MRLFTLGFTHKSAERFFSLLQESGAKRVVDVRLHNVSQLAGFSKRDDLKYFLRTICDLDYVHIPLLAPTAEMLEEYRKSKGGWPQYEEKFLALLHSRRIEKSIDRRVLSESCLLCSEDTPEHCHRRLVAEYLQKHWSDVDIVHL
jgi:uncharacterized protein (DUF488 family)